MTIENALKKFQEYYLAKNYTDAKNILEKHSSEIDPIIWHYNMGITLAKLEQFAEARYHFLKAERKGLSSQELLESKSYVESKLEIDKWEKSLGFKDYFISGVKFIGDGPLTSLILLGTFFFLLFFKKIKNNKSFYVWTFGIGLLIGINYATKFMPFKMIMNSTSLYEGPSKIFIPRTEIPPGVIVLSLEYENWERVIYPMRFEGWITKTSASKNLGD